MSSSGVNPAAPGPQAAPFDPTEEAAQLASLFYRLSQALDDFRLKNWDSIQPDDRGRLKDEAQALDTRAHYFTADAIGQTLKKIQGNLQNLKDTTANAKQAVANLNTVSKVISIATAGVVLAAAIASGNVGSIAAGVTGLAQTIST